MFGGAIGIIPGPINGSMYEDRHRGLSLRLISAESCESWLKYRDNRNDTAHQYKIFLDTVVKI